MPTLLYLPSLTPTNESLRLLKPAYKVLFELGDVRWCEVVAEKQKLGEGEVEKRELEKLKFWERVLRQGILQGLIHVGENVEIMEILIGEMGVLIGKMGVYTVKHLKVCLSFPLHILFLYPPFIHVR